MASDIISCDLVGDLPFVAAREWSDRTALVFKGRTWTYKEFEDEVATLARALVRAGVRKGERVALWLPNCPEIEFLLFAVARVGAIAVPLNTRYKSMDLAYALKHSGSAFLISCTRTGPVDLDSILAGALGGSKAGAEGGLVFEVAPELRTIVMMGDSQVLGGVPWDAFRESGRLAGGDEPFPAIQPSEPAFMMFTSGTTGNPKAVLLDHAGLRLCYERTRIMQMTSSDVQLAYLPQFHVYAISYSVLMSFMAGATQVLMDVFNGEQALRLIEEHRVTMIHGFEAHFADLLSAQDRLHLDIDSLRTGSFAAGSESAIALAERVQRELCETSSSYGLTEVWGGITISPPGSTLSQRCEGSGLAQSGIEIRIVDVDTGKVLPPNTIGEIQVRSYARLMGYYKDPAATAAALDADGWFRTGDAGLLRPDGHLRCLARYKDMLKVGGENVAPAEIEHLLCQIPGVKAAAVVGQRHERLLEVPAAFVVKDPRCTLSEQDIIDSFRGKIANFKIPARVVFVDELPMTSTGKIQKEVLRRRVATS
ncbi:AMP-binding protein [Variovorax paradoxus]|nr:AMP-binding protein [Variovorax paradoxus]MBT2304861.1 AMP-binding protein [Variovorax paradoxus]